MGQWQSSEALYSTTVCMPGQAISRAGLAARIHPRYFHRQSLSYRANYLSGPVAWKETYLAVMT